MWNLVTLAGGRAVVCGWQASHPAEPVAGAFVSNAFAVPPAGPNPTTNAGATGLNTRATGNPAGSGDAGQ